MTAELGSPYWGVRLLALKELERGDRAPANDVLPRVVACLKDETVAVRRAAAAVLFAHPDPTATHALLAAADDANKDVRSLVAAALGRLGDCSDVRLALADSSPFVRAVAAEATRGWSTDARPRHLIAQLLSDEATVVRHAAVLAVYDEPQDLRGRLLPRSRLRTPAPPSA